MGYMGTEGNSSLYGLFMFSKQIVICGSIAVDGHIIPKIFVLLFSSFKCVK